MIFLTPITIKSIKLQVTNNMLLVTDNRFLNKIISIFRFSLNSDKLWAD